MSFFEIDCPWCGEHYHFGLVGSSMFTPPHECKVKAECDVIDCDEPGIFYVISEWPNGIRSFSCDAHLDNRTIIMCQGYGDVD